MRLNLREEVKLMKTKILVIALVLVFVMVPLSGVYAQKVKPTGEPIKIGVLLPYTEPLSWVVGFVPAVDLALKEINEAGGFHGRPVVKIEADTESKADATVAAARKLLKVL